MTTADAMRQAARALGLDPGDDLLDGLTPFVDAALAATEPPDYVVEEPPLRPDVRPTETDNPLRAWYRQTSIDPTASGLLDGRTIAVKDNIAVAGVGMCNGSAVLEGFVPARDATVVERVLQAGGEVIGKAVCESLCLSTGSHTASTGPVLNPHDPTRTSGGSSSGCAALVASGAVDLAIGADQGGSIRIPAALCGVVGLKPTYGVVPYTGAFALDPTLDHIGPIATTVADAAMLLAAIAGPDDGDPRQLGVAPLELDPSLPQPSVGRRVGRLVDGFRWPGSDERVDVTVRDAIDRGASAGLEVADVSVPDHRRASQLVGTIVNQGLAALLFRDGGAGTGWRAHTPVDMIEAWRTGLRERSAELSPNVLAMALVGQRIWERDRAAPYVQAQNAVFALRAAYDRALASFDVLALPTTQHVAASLPRPEAELGEWIVASFPNAANTAAFDATGHPAITIPCGRVDGLPVGLMLVGRHGQDELVLSVAQTYERALARGHNGTRP